MELEYRAITYQAKAISVPGRGRETWKMGTAKYAEYAKNDSGFPRSACFRFDGLSQVFYRTGVASLRGAWHRPGLPSRILRISRFKSRSEGCLVL